MSLLFHTSFTFVLEGMADGCVSAWDIPVPSACIWAATNKEVPGGFWISVLLKVDEKLLQL